MANHSMHAGPLETTSPQQDLRLPASPAPTLATGEHSPPTPPPDSPTASRVTVNLSARATAALNAIVALTGDSKTEAINKSLQAYALIQAAQAEGGGAWLQDNSSERPSKVRFY